MFEDIVRVGAGMVVGWNLFNGTWDVLRRRPRALPWALAILYVSVLLQHTPVKPFPLQGGPLW